MKPNTLYTIVIISSVSLAIFFKLLFNDTITIISPNTLLPSSLELQPATIHISKSKGKITNVKGGIRNDLRKGKVLYLNSQQWLLPGLIDTHVHINDPGRSHWEDFESATKSAISKGVTTLVDMPLNSIPSTIDVESLNLKRTLADGNIYANLAFYGGSVPGNEKNLIHLLNNGVKGLKSFMVNSGVDEFQMVSIKDIEKAMKSLKNTNATLLYHAEVDLKKSKKSKKHNVEVDTKDYNTYLDSRPDEMEVEAIKLLIQKLRKYPNLHVHIVHLSSSKALPYIRQARADGLNLTVETCVHYLFFNAEDIPYGDVSYKCSPPIRNYENNIELLHALKHGDIDFITSDHSPSDPEVKKIEKGDFNDGWGGISGLGMGLPSLWTLVDKEYISIGEIVNWLSVNPAKFLGLENVKGKIQIGFDADMLIFEPNRNYTLTGEDLQYKHKVSPYIGKNFTGDITATYLNGKKVFDKYMGGIITNKPLGKLL